MTTRRAPTVPLLHGAEIPQLGLGTWPMKDDEAEASVARAIEIGYRLIDTAYSYGNEKGVGLGIAASGIAREELFVTTKLNGAWHGVQEAQEACESSLARLGLEYLDLYLIHWPLPRRDRFVDAWRGLVALLERGLVRAIGVSNFKPAHLDRLISETGVVPDVNQIELNPFLARDLSRSYNSKNGIQTESWRPIGQGGDLLSDPTIVEIARLHAKTPAQVVLRWHVDLGLVPIPKSSREDRLRENLDVFDFALTAEEISRISSLDRGDAAAVDSDLIGH